MSRTQRSPLVAGLLSFLQPGLGHLYLRAWVRSVLWFGLWVGTVVLLVPVDQGSGGILETLVRVGGIVAERPLEVTLMLASITVFSTLDAYWLATQQNAREEQGPRCPHCGQEVDPELEFCHWCTEPIEWQGDEGRYRPPEESPAR